MGTSCVTNLEFLVLDFCIHFYVYDFSLQSFNQV